MRLEFSAKVRDQAAKRAGGKCEACGMPFKGRCEFDHILPAALGGTADLANCRALCVECHKSKTADDVRGIRKADRQRRANNGSKLDAKNPIRSRGFEKKPPKEKIALPPRRPMFE